MTAKPPDDGVPSAGRSAEQTPRTERRYLLIAAALGALIFAYQVPLGIVAPTNLRWMMKADRGASLLEWLFERNEPWTLPFGILHTMMAPLVTLADGLLTAPSKLLFSWITVPWQYFGALLMALYALQAVFGYLILRALGVQRNVSLLGAAFFALSPALLQRFEHISLSAHCEILAGWWLCLRPPPRGPSWRLLVPWLLLVWIAIPTHPYLAAMVGALALAGYMRAVWIDHLFSWRTAAWHAVVAGLSIYAVFWIFAYFVMSNHGEPGFGRFYADVFSFFNSAGSSSLVPHIPRMADRYDLFGPYESYYYLGLGMIVLMPISIALVIAAGRRRTVAAIAATSSATWPPLWPAVTVAILLFIYALATPVRVLGHEMFTVGLYDHFSDFTAWFRGSGRFAWPLYYLVMALTLAELGRRLTPGIALGLLVAALALQIKDTRPLRAFVRRDYSYAYPQLQAPEWHGIGRAFKSLRLVPPIVANRIACRHYDRQSDYEIKFGVLAAEQHMAFNSGSPARIDQLAPLCEPMIDSLKHGFVDEATVFIPSATYREAMEWWANGRVVCGTIEEANVCVARGGRNAASPLTRVLLQQEPVPPPIALDFDLRTGDAGSVDSTRDLGQDSATGRVIMGQVAHVYYSHSLVGPLTMVVDARPADTTAVVPLIVRLGDESRTILLGPGIPPDTLRFNGSPDARILSVGPGAARSSPHAPPGTSVVGGRPVRIRQINIAIP